MTSMREQTPKKRPGLLESRFGDLYVFAAVMLALSLCLRAALCAASWGDLDGGAWPLAKAFAVGLFFDLVTLSFVVAPVAIFRVLAPDSVFRSRIHKYVSLGVYFLALCVMLFDVAAEWLFWREFGARFNFVAVDYLIYTQELVGNIRESYPVAWIFAGIFACAAAIWALTFRPIVKAFRSRSTFRRRLLPGVGFLAVPVLSLLLVDQTLANVSRNFFTNELARNGPYSFVWALWHNIIDYDQFYLTRDESEVFGRTRKLLAADNAPFESNDPFDITRMVANPGPERRHNVVIVVVESLSAEYLGALGDKRGLTPNLDELAARGLLFRNFYATGTRTDRGLEAVTLSVPPTPGRSLLKREDNDGLFSLGSVLAERSYDRTFLCGGYSAFDNMAGFYRGNGFATVDRGDLAKDEITFANAWGVCDEDLFRRLLKECDRSFEAGRPFLCIAVTTSNHRPFTFPPNPHVPARHDRHGAVMYTDYAIGRLLADAESRPWFDNTIFAVLADHCAGSAGKTEVPVDKYHIPLLLYAPKIITQEMIARHAGKTDRLASQIDLAPTILGLLRCSYRSKFYGRDLLADANAAGRAFVGNYQKVGLYYPGSLTLLMPVRRSVAYRIDEKGEQTEAAQASDEHLLDAVAYYQSASYLFRHGLFRSR